MTVVVRDSESEVRSSGTPRRRRVANTRWTVRPTIRSQTSRSVPARLGANPPNPVHARSLFHNESRKRAVEFRRGSAPLAFRLGLAQRKRRVVLLRQCPRCGFLASPSVPRIRFMVPCSEPGAGQAYGMHWAGPWKRLGDGSSDSGKRFKKPWRRHLLSCTWLTQTQTRTLQFSIGSLLEIPRLSS